MPEQKTTNYGEELTRLARALARAEEEMAATVLAPGSNLQQLRAFTEELADKRVDTLQRQLKFLGDAFTNLRELLQGYCDAQPQLAYASPTSEGELCLDWIEQTQELTPEQKDYVACQRARHAVENLARYNRLGHVRFQELATLTEQLLLELDQNPKLRIHLNPMRTWSRFQTSVLLDEEASLPADVIFFAVRGNVHTIVLEEEGRTLVESLEEIGPCTVDQWLRGHEGVPRSEFIELLSDLASLGLVAFS